MILYTLKDIAIILGMTKEAIAYRAKMLGYEKKHSIYLFNSNQLENITNFKKQRLITEDEGEVVMTKVIREVIEIHHNIEIYQSKMNF